MIFMLDAVADTAITTAELVEAIGTQMRDAKHRLRSELPKIYSQEVLNNLFHHPCTPIDYVQSELGIARQTAARYLDTLAENGFVEKHHAGKSNYYINTALVHLLMTGSDQT